MRKKDYSYLRQIRDIERLRKEYLENSEDIDVLKNLIQNPVFPVRFSLNIIQKLFPVNLIEIIKNMRVNPFIRKKAEMEFVQRYQKLSLGEKKSLIKVAPVSLLKNLVDERDKRIILVIFNNPYCTEELVLRFINRTSDRYPIYEIIRDTKWLMYPRVIDAIINDIQAPIMLLISLLDRMNINQLKNMLKREYLHESVRIQVIEKINKKNKKIKKELI